MQRAVEWMLSRDWQRLTAKRREFNQSLLEHTLVELDATLNLVPILRLPQHLGLSEGEEQVIIASIIAHDVGKERPEWQSYILGQGPFVPDIEPALTRSVIPHLCAALGFSALDQKVMAVMENCVNLHMSGARTDTNVITAIFQGTDRWFLLADVVSQIDNICSAKGVLEARAALERSTLLGNHLKTAYHQVVVRGVSTIALHRAALESFEQAGWTPLLHFSDATLYVCSAARPAQEPAPAQIESRLEEVLRVTTGREVTQFIVGSPTANIMPKPDLFEHSEIRMYLEAATHKVGRKSFITAYEREKKRFAGSRPPATGRGKSKAKVIEDYWMMAGKTSGPRYSPQMDLEAERISTAQPDMVVFKFFKAAMQAGLVGDGGIEVARQEYEAVFGLGSWTALTSTSTLMPDRDMAKTVDLFWRLPGQRFGLAAHQVEELAPEKRTELLIDTLTGIANKVYAAIPDPPTRATLARKMAASFMQDLIAPATGVDPTSLARQQVEFYAVSKPFAGKQVKRARYLCPICNTPFKEGTKATADYIDKPESHTNRGIAHGPFGYITICDTCKYERVLRQLLLGDRAQELIVIFPRMNIGPGAGELLMQKVRALYNKAWAVMTGDTGDPDRRLWLAFTPSIADKVLDQDVFRLTPEQIVDLLAYRSGQETRRNNWRQLEKAIQEAYEGDLEAANIEWGTEFASWEEAVAAVYANQVADPTAQRIREEVYRLYPQMRLVCQTPHVIMFPVSYPIRLGDDSDTNAALRQLFVALLLGLSLEASVALVYDSDQIDFQGGEGVAFVPPVVAVRELVGFNWVPLSEAEHWLRRIGVAAILASSGQYSERSGLYEVLAAPTPGHVLRRIEQKRVSEGQTLRYQDVVYLRVLQETMAR